MATDSSRSYRQAITILNSFRCPLHYTNEEAQEDNKTSGERMRKLLGWIGITLDQIDSLNIIHVTGTKGKGSTCFLMEKMLRSLGYKTGLHSNPQYLHTTELIRVGGIPISQEKFAEVFFQFEEQFRKFHAEDHLKIRIYQKIVWSICMYIFIQEKIDVAVIEVGIGGEYCHSNIIRSPIVSLIATLDVDHVSRLGSTIEQIAWHKSGIFKKGVPAIVTPCVPAAWKIFEERSEEKEAASLSMAPSFHDYLSELPIVNQDRYGVHQYFNISLALQGVMMWLSAQSDKELVPSDWIPGQSFTIPSVLCTALEQCQLPGRSEIVKRGNITYYMDPAHTPVSIEACCKWFDSVASRNQRRILVFTIANRDNTQVLMPVKDFLFDQVIFCPPMIDEYFDPNSDVGFRPMIHEEEIETSKDNVKIWKKMTNQDSILLSCVRNTNDWLERESKSEPLQVLVVGLFMCGAFLEIVDPQLLLRPA